MTEVTELTQQCFFCKVLGDDSPARKVYEDEHCIGILDAKPATPGHVLLVPKGHFKSMQEVPQQLLQHLFVVMKKISHALLRMFKTEGTSMFIANGQAAGQRAPHFIMHIMPRHPNDHIKLAPPRNKADPEGLEETRMLLTHRYEQQYEKQRGTEQNTQSGDSS